MKTLKRVLAGFAAAAALLLATGCPQPQAPEAEVVEAVTFDKAVGTYPEGTEIKLSSATKNVTIYYSTTKEVTSENYFESDTGIVAGVAKTSAATVTLSASCTVYALAVNPDTGACSAPSSRDYSVGGPAPVTVTVSSGAADAENNVVYSGAKIKLSSSNQEGVTGDLKIYYSFDPFTVTSYTDLSYVASDGEVDTTGKGTLKDGFSLYAIAVTTVNKGTEEAPEYEVTTSLVKKVDFTYAVSYAPLTAEANYTIDGNLSKLVNKVGYSTASVTLDEGVVYSGIVTQIVDYTTKTANHWISVQDKDNAVQLYAGYDQTSHFDGYYIGEYVEFTAAAAQKYQGVTEVTSYEVTGTDETKDAGTIYFTNITGCTDFSGLESMKLYGIYAIGKNYNTAVNTIYGKTSVDTAAAYFGYVGDYSRVIELSNVADATGWITEETTKSPYTNKVELVTSDATTYALTQSASIAKNGTVSLTTLTPNAKIYYTTDGTDPTTESTLFDSTSPIALFDTIGNKVTVKAIGAVEGYENSDVVTMNFETIWGEEVNFADSGVATAAELKAFSGDNFAVTFDKGTNSNAAKYYTSGGSRFYGSNSMTISSDTYEIVKVVIYGADSANFGTFVVDTGAIERDATNLVYTWTGSSASITFTVDGKTQCRISKAVVFYSETPLIEKPVFTPADGSIVEKDSTVAISGPEGATVYYSTAEKLTAANYATAGTAYSEPIVIDGAKTIYAISIIAGDTVKYSACATAVYELKNPAALVANIAADDKVILVNPTSKVAVGLAASGAKLAGVTVNAADKKCDAISTVAVFTVGTVADGDNTYYTFKNAEGKYLSATAATQGCAYVDEVGDTAKFAVTTSATDATVHYLTTVSADDKAYVEYYGGFTGYKNAGTSAAYEFNFYKVGLTESTVVDSVAFDVAAGSVDKNTALTLTAETGAKIYYQKIAADDTTTTVMTAENYATTGTEYTAALSIDAACTVYAIAEKTINETAYVSGVKSAAYTIKAAVVTSDSFDFTTLTDLPTAGDGCSLTWSKTSPKLTGVTGSSDPKWYSSTARLYRYNGLTITSTQSKKIKSIVFTINDASKIGSDTATDVGTLSAFDTTNLTYTWSGSETEVVLSNTGTTNVQLHLKKIEITYGD